MRVLVTGGAGFIGSHLTDRLIRDGHDVVVIDNLLTGRRENVNPEARFHQWDITDGTVIQRSETPDVIAHCAASYSDRTDWARDVLTNALATAWLMKAALAGGVQRVVYFQTALCYGHDPYGIHDPRPLLTTQPLNPDNSYAISKTAGELYIRHSGIPYVSLRLANVYGPRNLSGPIPTFFKRLTEGQPCVVTDSRRDFIYIDDLLDVAVPALMGTGHGVYHVSSGRDYSIWEAFHAVSKEVFGEEVSRVEGRLVPRPPDDSPSILLDPTYTQATFNWKATTRFEDGIAKAVAWYREHGVERTFTHLSLKG